MRRPHHLLVILALLLAGLPTWAASWELSGNQVTAGGGRITVLSPTLVRMEYSPTGTFVDDPSVLVLNRDWSACPFEVTEEDGCLILKTSALELRWQMDGAPFGQANLIIAWNAGGMSGQWRPGQVDHGNLGGTRGALDGIGRGYLPPLDPGLLSREGWTLLDDSWRPLWLGEDGWLKERPDYAARDWYFFAYGSDYARMLTEYVTLCGRIPLLPRYAWGAWYSRYWPFTDEQERAIVRRFRELGIPLDVLVIDVDWHQYGWEGYDWNPELFPDPEGFLKWVHEQGVHVSLNNHPASPLPVEDSHHAAAAEMAGLTGEARKQPIVWDLAQKPLNRAFVEAVHWPLERMGVDFWWIDGNPAANMPGLDSTMWCAKTYYDGTARRTGQRSLVFSRYTGLGQHRYPVGFSGDVHSTWDVLNYEVRFTARAGNVAFPYWSHDIGGFLGDRLDPELYVRWCQFGALSPVLRLHSNHGVREPWEYGEQAQTIVGDYFRLRQRLYPYLNTCQRQVYDTGLPLCRPLYFHWPQLEEAYQFDYQYLLGPNLLVAPITEPADGSAASKQVWIPPGLWWDWWTGDPIQGPRTIVYRAPLERCPLFARAGAVIPMQPDMDFMGQRPADPLTLEVWAGGPADFSVYEDDGLSMAYQQGAFTTTPVSMSEREGALVATIGPRQGVFEGMLQEREYILRVHGVTPPRAVMLNGQPVDVGNGETAADAAAWWTCEPDVGEVTVHVPRSPADQQSVVELRGAARAQFLSLRARLRGIRQRAAEAVGVGRIMGLDPRALGKLQEVETAAGAALAAIGPESDLPRALMDRVTETVREAWAAVGGAGTDSSPQGRVLKTLAGLSASVYITRTQGSPDSQVRVLVSSETPLEGATLRGQPVVQQPWELVGEVQSDLADFATSGGGVMTFQVRGPETLAEPPLGVVTLGADLTVDFAGAPLVLTARGGLDCSFVQQWHLIGPFSNRGSRGLETVYPPEQEMDFTRSYPGLEGEATWQTTGWHQPPVGDDPAVFIDLEPRFRPKDGTVAYAYAFIIADEEKAAVLSIGTDDGCKVWLNDELVLSHPEPRPPAPGQDRVNVILRRGVNVVRYKVANEGGQWGLYLQVIGPDGKPLPGLKTTLEPPR